MTQLNRPILFWFLFFTASLVLGFALTYNGTGTWDLGFGLQHTEWLLCKYKSKAPCEDIGHVQWYGPLWMLVLGVFQKLFKFLHDPVWVRTSVNFALLPITLALVAVGLRKRGWTNAAVLLGLALPLSLIRWGGHALGNDKDFPFASVYLLATVWGFPLLHPLFASRLTPRRSLFHILILALLAVSTYLLRPPVALHAAVFFVGIVAVSILRRTFVRLGAYLLFCGVLLYALYPPLWTWGWLGFLESFSLFSKFPWSGMIRFWGQSYASYDLPWYYLFSWIPVAFIPLGSLLLPFGLVAGFASRFSLEFLWDFGFAAIPVAAVLYQHPTLYDEERHLLWILLSIAFATASGLKNSKYLSARSMKTLAALLLVGSAFAYIQWHRYSYVYKSSWVPKNLQTQFMGEYYGICIGPAVLHLLESKDPLSSIQVLGPTWEAQVIAASFQSSRFRSQVSKSALSIDSMPPKKGDYWLLEYGRDDGSLNSFKALGSTPPLYVDFLPTGEPTCLVTRKSQP